MAKLSIKHLQINKANHAVIVATAIGAAIAVLGLFIGRGVWVRYSHQEAVIDAKTTSLKLLEANIVSKNQIVESYKNFVDPAKSTNIIGGLIVGEDDKDGDNARLVLDALPSKYDFPALATSLDKMLRGNGYVVTAIDGTDDEIAQATSTESAPVEIPIGVSVENADYDGIQDIVRLFGRSIRPFKIQTMTISGGGNTMTIDLKVTAYFQPEKKFEIGTEIIK
jgi:hypothetical protein